MSLKIAVVLLLVCAIPKAIGAQGVGSLPDPSKPLGSMQPSPGTEYYPANLVSLGAHGTALVKVEIAPGGSLVNPVIEQSSKSEDLDALALAYVKTKKVTPKEGITLPPTGIFEVVFERDSLETITKKTCGEFNTDLAYARKGSPDLAAGELRSYKLALGIVLFAPDIPQEKRFALARALKKNPAEMEKRCAAAPDANFMKTLIDTELPKSK